METGSLVIIGFIVLLFIIIKFKNNAILRLPKDKKAIIDFSNFRTAYFLAMTGIIGLYFTLIYAISKIFPNFYKAWKTDYETFIYCNTEIIILIILIFLYIKHKSKFIIIPFLVFLLLLAIATNSIIENWPHNTTTNYSYQNQKSYSNNNQQTLPKNSDTETKEKLEYPKNETGKKKIIGKYKVLLPLDGSWSTRANIAKIRKNNKKFSLATTYKLFWDEDIWVDMNPVPEGMENPMFLPKDTGATELLFPGVREFKFRINEQTKEQTFVTIKFY